MSLWRLVTRSFWFYWRTNVAVLLAVVVATAVLTGALAVGDSVRYTLRRTLDARLGKVEFAVLPQGRFFRSQLADDLEHSLGGTVAPVLQVAGIITNEDGSRRINRIQVLGVNDKFYALGPAQAMQPGDDVIVSESVARELKVAAGDEVVLRVEKSAVMPRDVPLISDEDRTVASRLKVRVVAGESNFGRFGLQANQTAPFNVFVPLAWLGRQIQQQGQANMLLAAGLPHTMEQVNAAIKSVWQPADAGLELRRVEPQNVLELRSRRIFIDESLSAGVLMAGDNTAGVLTYFVNEIRLGDKATPYSMVTAGGAVGLLPPGMRDDEIIINDWLAGDLNARIGDSLDLTYYVMGLNRQLHEEHRRFNVVKIVPLEGPAADPNLMPDFPGLADVENCRDWKPGIPIDLDRIRPKDEKYWNEHRGTPKAFITLHAGQAIWQNRYGNLTAVRYPWREGLEREIEQRLRSRIDPAAVGLYFQPVRQRGLKAGGGSSDFGQLFLGLSMFLIGSAIILTGLLFVFGVESRSSQVGILLAVGWPARRVRRLLLAEGGLVALFGTMAGVGAGLLYTATMVYGLSTFWRGAVGGTTIYFHAGVVSLFGGGLGGLCVVLLAVRVSLRRQVTRPIRQLLTGNVEEGLTIHRRVRKGWLGLMVAAVSFAGAAILLTATAGRDSQAVAGAFFGAGALLLLGGVGLSHSLLRSVAGRSKPTISLRGLSLRNAARRAGRSLAVIALLACGVFLVVAVGANRRNPLAEPQSRSSGTGGFALYGESSVGIVRQLPGVDAVPFRVHEGDDASCLNLNRAQQPRLLGVQPEALKQRGAFTFTAALEPGRETGWGLLEADLGGDVVPAVGDYPTVFWALGKNIGDEVEYTDEMGRAFHVRIVGMLASSILQGSLIVAEDKFTAKFPSVAGHRVFLINAPGDRLDAVTQSLSSELRDYGLMMTPTGERLAGFTAVENTYLSIFTVLGGLGLVLGSIGLGLVVLRNMLERRGELAMLRAVGFDKARLRWMVFDEHWPLCLAGLAWGGIAAVTAVIPALKSPGGQVPYVLLLATIAAIGLSGAVWVWLAATVALRGRLLDALRNE
jgi:putative ABC transport system permease protein